MDRELIKKILSALPSLFFIIVVVLPLASVFAVSFTEGGSITLEHYLAVYHLQTLALLLKSCVLAASVAIIATIIGALFGYVLSSTDLPFSSPLKLLFLLPLFVSPYYLAVAMHDFVFLLLGNTRMLNSEEAVAAILIMSYAPIPFLIMSASFANINSRMEEAGLLVASKMRTAWSIIFPLVKPAFVSSFVLVFILAVAEITVPSYYLVNLFPTELFMQFTAFYNHKTAIALGSAICLISNVLLLMERSFLTNAPFLAIGKKGSTKRTATLGNWKYPVLVVAVSYLVFVVIIPLVGLSMQAFRESMPDYLRDKSMPAGYLPLENELGYSMNYLYKGFALLKPVILDSLLYALLGSLLICILGFVFAYRSERKKIKWMDYLLLLVFAIPSTIFGIALIKFYNRASLEFIYTSAFIILIGYIGKFTFVASRMIGNSIRQVPYSLEEAAELTGAKSLTRFWYILFPLVLEGFFAAFIVCFIFCLGEMATTIVIYPPGNSLLPIKIATSMHNTPDGLISAMVFIILLLTFSLLGILYGIKKYFIKRTIL